MAELNDTIAVQGMAALGEKLKQLQLDMKEKIATKADLAAAQIGLAAVQDETPVRTGNLLHHIRVARRHRGVPDTQIQHVVFVKQDGGKRAKEKNFGEDLPYYWYFIEFGWVDRGGNHHQANPFMLRGFLKSADNAATRARDIAAYWLQRYQR